VVKDFCYDARGNIIDGAKPKAETTRHRYVRDMPAARPRESSLPAT